MSGKGFRSLATILADTLGDPNQGLTSALARHNAVLASIQAGWAETTPAPLREHCRPIHYQAGQITVEADSSAWASRLRQQSDGLLQALCLLDGLPKLTQIRIKVNPQAPVIPPDTNNPQGHHKTTANHSPGVSPKTHTKPKSRR
ncbi:MAG: DUF721 domain-containing protein [Gammaproteobacteria bacterium]|nr:DUF721 domain-containing protein [Gammaproteobacteria bacterium]